MELRPIAKRYEKLYKAGRVDVAGLENAVKRGLITQEEHDFILRKAPLEE